MHVHHEDDSLTALPCICTALRKASRAVTRAYDEVMEGAGMSVAQFAVLRNLARHGWVTIAEGEGRAKIATLSPAGEQAIADATAGWARVQTAMLQQIGADDWRELEAALGRIVAATRECGA